MLVIQKATYDTYIQYMYWEPNNIDNEYTYGPGVEVTINKPKYEYIYPQDYPFGDGWERVSSQSNIYDIYGRVSTLGRGQDGTGVLFNLKNTPPLFRNLHATTEYKLLSTKLLAIVWLDIFYSYQTTPYASTDLSEDALKIVKKLDAWGLFSMPKQINKNSRSKDKYDSFIIKSETNKIIDIKDYEFYWCSNRLKDEAIKWRNSYKNVEEDIYNVYEQSRLV